MQKKKVLIIGIVVALIILCIEIVILFIMYDKEKSNPDNISRQDWIKLLGENTGATEFGEDKPYFKDIDKNSEYYPYIQSAVEWEYIKAGVKFNGKKNAIGKFIAITAMKSIGEPKLQLYLGTDKALKDNDYLELALNLDLVNKENLKEGMSLGDAQKIIEKLEQIRYGELWARSIEEVEYQDDVIELKESDITYYDRETDTVKTSIRLHNGDVISFRTGKFQLVKKVLNDLPNGMYELETPSMEDAYVKIKQSGVNEITFEDVINYYGEDNVEVVQADDFTPEAVQVLWSEKENLESLGFKIEAEVDGEELNVYVTDHEKNIKYQLPISLEVSKEFEGLSASVDINRIFVGSQLVYDLRGVNFADVAVDIESNCKVSIEQDDVASERIKLFETPVPIGNGVVGVDIQVYLVVSLSGDIYLKAEIPYQTELYYEKGKGVRNIQHELSIDKPELKINADVESKIETALILLAGDWPVIDAEMGAGVISHAQVQMRENKQICADIGIEFPVVDMSVGQSEVLYRDKESLLASLGCSKNWDNIFRNYSFYKTYNQHFEKIPDGSSKYVDKCTYKNRLIVKKSEKHMDGSTTIDNNLQRDYIAGFEFSTYAGTYVATNETNDFYGGGKKVDDLVLDKKGIITGGGTYYMPNPYPAKKPISVEINEDGAYKCVVDEMGDYIGNEYYIYPEGVVEDRFKDDPILVNSIYIRYFQYDGGVGDFVYVKSDGTSMNTHLTSDDGEMPQFAIDYPDSWEIASEEVESDYEQVVFTNKRGIEVTYYSNVNGFGSQYYGGAGEVEYVHITKVADSAFKKYVVAKLEVYAYEDGLAEEGIHKYDGATYYALVPPDYLGDNNFCGPGYWALCSSKCVRPLAFLAESPTGKFKDEEAIDVIKILSSFRLE